MSRHMVGLLGVCLLLAGVMPARADDSVCTLELEACGELSQKLSPLVTAKETGCWTFELGALGAKPASRLAANFKVFLGFELKAGVFLFNGAGSSGVVLNCKWAVEDRKPEDKNADLKRQAPKLLMASPEFRKAFPAVKSIDLTKLKFMDEPSLLCQKGLKEFCDAKKR